MKTPVVILGYDRLGRQLAAALDRQPDLQVSLVCDTAPHRLTEAGRRGWQVSDSLSPAVSDPCSRFVDCRSWKEQGGGVTVFPAKGGSGSITLTLLARLRAGRGGHTFRVPGANVLAYTRLFSALGKAGGIRRARSTVVEPPNPETQGSIDELKPVFGSSLETDEIRSAAAELVPELHLCRVSAPYTRSCLHMVELEFRAPAPSSEMIRQALETAPRLVVGSARDGFSGTAQVQEFCRDTDRLAGARPEVFIWLESIVAQDGLVHLIMDVERETTPIPETVDAIRLSAQPELTLRESVALTDHALGLKLEFEQVTSTCGERQVNTALTAK